MSINFETFIQQTGFSPTYAARKILYYPLSRPALIAKAMELDVSGNERTRMVKICANKIKLGDYSTNQRSQETEEQVSAEGQAA